VSREFRDDPGDHVVPHEHLVPAFVTERSERLVELAVGDDRGRREGRDVLDVRFGSLWTNISHELFTELGVDYGKRVEVAIRNDTRELYRNTMVYARSFAEVNVGEPLVYINSILNVAVAINQGSFSRAYSIGTGLSWKLSLRKAPRIVYE